MRKALFILGDLDDSDIEWLAAAASKQEFEDASVLIREGQQIADVYLLLGGRLSVRVGPQQDEEINSLLPGEFIGELSFLDSRPPSATVVAATRSTVAAIPRETLKAKLDRDSAFAGRFYRALGVFLAHRLRRQTVRTSGAAGSTDLSEEAEAEDELDPALLESVALAAKRFEWIQGKFAGG